MKYSFYINEGGYPEFLVEQKYWQINELGSFELEEIIKIVSNLEDIFLSKYEQYDFGYEVYSIECNKNISNVVDTFDDFKVIAIIPTQELYEMIRDWRDFLIEYYTNKT